MNSLTANGVGLRAEHFLTDIGSRFAQTTADFSHSFSKDFKVHVLGGWSESHMQEPVETTLTYDYNGGQAANGTFLGAQGYSYQYFGYSQIPALKYGSAADTSGNVTSLNNWFISQMRERAEANYNSFRTVSGDAEYHPFGWLKLSGGIDYKNYGYRTVSLQRSNGTTANQDFNIPADIRAANLNNFSQLVTLRGIDLPAGSAASWMIPNIDAFNKQFDIFSPDFGEWRLQVRPRARADLQRFRAGKRHGLLASGRLGRPFLRRSFPGQYRRAVYRNRQRVPGLQL